MSKWQKGFLILLTALALFFLDRAYFFDGIYNLVRRGLIKPIAGLVVGSEEEIGFFFKEVFGLRSIIKENSFLKSERDFFRGEYFKLSEVRLENDYLRKALEIDKKSSYKIILAEISSLDPFQASDSFMVSKGSQAGVKIGQAVILPGNILVGKVGEVKENESRVVLITSSESRIPAFIEEANSKGVVSGSASGALTLDLVLKDVGLGTGQILVSAGLDEGVPSGLLIGEVVKILSSESSSFQKASARAFFNLRDLKHVMILSVN